MNIYYQVVEYFPDPENEIGKRLIYTFDNEMAAHMLVEFILQNDMMKPDVGVEEYETTT